LKIVRNEFGIIYANLQSCKIKKSVRNSYDT
jgi:hypothetical protein